MKKMLALLLVLSMLFGMVPAAFAEEIALESAVTSVVEEPVETVPEEPEDEAEEVPAEIPEETAAPEDVQEPVETEPEQEIPAEPEPAKEQPQETEPTEPEEEEILLESSFVALDTEAVSFGTYQGMEFRIEDGEITITACETNVSGQLDIPSNIGGVPVAAIGDNAFASCRKITGITLPNSLKRIGSRAFADAFPSVYELDYYKGSDITITIPASVASIGPSVFAGARVNFLSVAAGNTAYKNDARGVLYSLDGMQLVAAPLTLADSYSIPAGVQTIADDAFRGARITAVNLPFGVQTIGANAFMYCSGLTSVNIPVGVTSIGESAFSSCSKLQSISIPESVTSIGGNAFSGCGSLQSVSLPDGITIIENSTLSGCSALQTVKLPSRLKSIGNSAFSSCKNMKSIEIPGTVQTIGENAFQGSGLTRVSIPASVTKLGWRAFSSCGDLTDIFFEAAGNITFSSWCFEVGSKLDTNIYVPDANNVPANLKNYNWAGDNRNVTYKSTSFNVKYEKLPDGTLILTYCDPMFTIGDFVIPFAVDGVPVTAIAPGAFRDCNQMTSVYIPATVNAIGSEAFVGCSGLEQVTFEGSAPAIAQDSFKGVDADVSYPAGDGTWNGAKANFGGDLTWKDPGDRVPMFRLYNPYTQEHLLCSNPAEKNALLIAGWSLDGTAWQAPLTGTRVYRLYNPYDDWHTYSTNDEEIAKMTAMGWTVDGVVSFSAADGRPIYRLFNPYVQTNYHMLTASAEERDFLAGLGWIFEGVAWSAAK